MPDEERRRRGEQATRPPAVVGGRSAPPMPRGLSEFAKVVWRQTVELLVEAEAIDAADAGMLESFAVNLGRAREARAVLNREGILHRNSQGVVAHPAIAIEAQALREVRLLSEGLPLSPWGRQRLGLAAGRGGAPAGAERELEDTIGAPPRLRMVRGLAARKEAAAGE